MHKIFSKYKSYFFTQMINSMQYLVLPLHQSSMYKKIAIDLALIYIEWQYQDIKEKIQKEPSTDNKQQALETIMNDSTKDIRDIFVNFFIKLAINSCQDKEDKENITKKALFLLKKWLILSPGFNIKYQSIEKFLNGIEQSLKQGYYRDGLDKNKSCFTVLQVISILIEFDKTENILQNMDLIYKLLTHNIANCFTCDNPYIIQLISNLTNKLLKLKDNTFRQRIIDLIENGVNAYISAYKTKSQNQNEQMRNQAITIYTTIRISKVLLEHKPDDLDKFYGSFLEISGIFIELFDKRLVYQTNPPKKSADEDEDLLVSIDSHYTEEGFENHKFSFTNLREFLIILLRILSQKLVKHASPESKEKKEMINLLESVMERLSDIDLTLEILSILNSLLLSDHYKDIKSHIPPIKGCFTTKEKVTYFLDPKKVQDILQKHHNMRHHDGERVLKKYSKLVIDLLRAISLSDIEKERLRKLIIILNKYVPTNLSDSLFEIVDTHFGNAFTKKLMFFLSEFSEDSYLSEAQEGEDDLV